MKKKLQFQENTLLIKAIIIFAFVFMNPIFISAQSASWNYVTQTGNLGTTYSWIDCSGGSEITTFSAGNADDGRQEINWPFNFSCYDDSYTTASQLSIGTNGFIRLDGNASINSGDATSFTLSSTSTGLGQVIALGTYDCNFGDANSHIYYLTQGSSPNRIFTIEFQDVEISYSHNNYADLQVSFYETTNKVVIKFGTDDVTQAGADIGIHSGVNTYYNDWQDVDNGTNNSWIEYTPPVACTSPTNQPTSLNLTPSQTEIDGTFTAATCSPDGYLVVRSLNSTLSSDPVNTTTYTTGQALGGGIVVQSSSATSFTATGLSMSTQYYFFIFSQNYACTGGPLYITTSPLTGNSTTLSMKTVPYSHNFDTGDSWAVSGTANIWERGDQTNTAYGPPSGHSGNTVYGTKLNANYGTNNVDAYLDSPPVSLSGTTAPEISFWMDMESEDNWDGGSLQLRVSGGTWITILMTDPGYTLNPPNNTDVDGVQNGEDGWCGTQPAGDWQEVTFRLFDLTTTGLSTITAANYIEVRYWFGTDGTTNNYAGWYIDDFSIYDCVPCTTPTNQATNLILTPEYTEIDGAFKTAACSPDGYLVIRSTDNTLSDPADLPVDATTYSTGNTIGDGTVVQFSSATNFTASGLAQSTQYYFFIFAYNNDGCTGGPKYRTTSPLTGNTTTLACGSSAFPYREDFEVAVPPTCWTSYRGTNGLGTNNDWVQDSPVPHPYSGSHHAYVSYENVTGGLAEDWLVTQQLSIGNNFELIYYERQAFPATFNSMYYIKKSTTSQTNHASFTDITSYSEAGWTDEYRKHTVDLSAYSGQNMYIAFVMTNDGDDCWSVDNVYIGVKQGRWIGSVSNDWQIPGNWGNNRVPDNTAAVTIPSGCTNYPLINEADNQCKSLDIQDGGSLTVTTGGTLTVSGNITLGSGATGILTITDGTLTSTGTLTANVGSNLYLTAGTFTPNAVSFNATSTTTYNGTGTSQDIYNYAYGNLIMNGTGTKQIIGTIASPTTCNALTINAGNVLNIAEGNALTVSGTLTNNAVSSGLVIKSSSSGTGSLIHSTVNIPATVERYLTGNNWHYLFAPLHLIDTLIFTDAGGGYYNPNILWYDESTADYWDATTAYGTTGWTKVSTPRLPTDKGFIFYYTENKTYTQTGGNLFAGQKDFSVDTTDNGTGAVGQNGVTADWNDFEGWNLVGNPYTSAFDWDAAGFDKTKIENVVYYYDDSSEQYKYYGGGTAYNQGISVNTGSQYVPVGQGFFVKATAVGTFSIPNSAREHKSQAFYKKNESIPDMLRLQIEKDEYSDETVIRTLPDATDEHDGNYDAHKMIPQNSDKPQLYTLTESKNHQFALNSLPEFTEYKVVPLGLYVGINDEYTINLTENNFENVHIFIEDQDLSQFINIREQQIYTFTQDAGIDNERFYLHFDTNDAPVVSQQIPDQETFTEVLYNYTLPENMFTDDDTGDELTVSVQLANGDELPEWLNFDNETQNFNGTPLDVQILDIVVTATDIFGASVSDDFILEVKNAVEINNPNENRILIYPNPNNGLFTISTGNNNSGYNIEITDAFGKIIVSLNTSKNIKEIDLSDCAAGIYFVKLTFNKGTVYKDKIIIE
ncbi:MAG: choice-of-anchor J domain-containing protein [Bacteroidales bacterium]|nr:choice-of-anchor J domain-containing protein [Bacteroidales bacterium]